MQWFSKLKSGEVGGGFGSALGTFLTSAASLIPEELKDLTTDPEQEQADENDPTYIELNPELIEYVSHLAQHPSTFTEFPIPRAPEGSFPLTRGQTRHARKMLDAVPALQKLRYSMCPSKMNEETFWRIYFLLLLNKTNGRSSSKAKAKDAPEKDKGGEDVRGKPQKVKVEHDDEDTRTRRKLQEVDVLPEHELEAYFEKMISEYQEKLASQLPEEELNPHMKRRGESYFLDDGIDPDDDNYFTRSSPKLKRQQQQAY